jgi:hypothetical protein
MTHPYSMYIWQSPLSPMDEGRWIEPLQAYTQEYALYIANLIHRDTRSVIKVVRYGLTIQCYPDTHAVERCEQVIEQQRRYPREPRRPWWVE